MTTTIITIGDEILIGQIVDTNSAWMATELNHLGIRIHDIHSVSDEREAITSAVQRAMQVSDVILITGGLGPTKDDITKKTLSELFKTDLYFHQETYDRICKLFERWGREPTEAHREQCYMPRSATILKNKKGTAPGMLFEEKGKIIVSMPGVPYEMKYLMEFEVLPRLKKLQPETVVLHRTILTVGEGESRIAKRIAAIEDGLPETIKLAYLPGLGKVRLRLTAVGTDESRLNRQLDKEVKAIEAEIPEFIFGYGTDTLEQVIGRMLVEAGKTLGTAESCTGGYIAHLITSIPGSSRYFHGSIIAYANKVKQNQLQVSDKTLMKHGAVSEPTVKEMIKGTIKTLGVDLAIATSGIAGPDGGTEEKPVGTIWLAVGDGEQIKTRKLQLSKDRLLNIKYTAYQALNLIRKFLLQQNEGLLKNP